MILGHIPINLSSCLHSIFGNCPPTLSTEPLYLIHPLIVRPLGKLLITLISLCPVKIPFQRSPGDKGFEFQILLELIAATYL